MTVALKNSLQTYITQNMYQGEKPWYCETLLSLSERVIRAVSVVFAKAALSIISFFSKPAQKDDLHCTVKQFSDLANTNGTFLSATIYLQTDAGSKEFIVTDLSTVEEESKELREKAVAAKILYCAVTEYQDAYPRFTYLFQGNGCSSAHFCLENIEKAKEVCDQKKAFYADQFKK